ncbi:MAG: hypothetical protein K5912_04250 [Alphaproteobacteria bacterium]|nr:hypothetical protein [Alphaproteobacteria bacterium]
MFSKKIHRLIVITTFDPVALQVSVPSLSKLGRKFDLLIYNDNPEVQIKKRQIRKLGWHGGLRIVNGNENLGEFNAKLEAIKLAVVGDFDWITFLDDDDMMISVDLPSVGPEVFAVLQNATTLESSHTDLLKINKTWIEGTETGITGPHFDIRGTWIRPNVLREFLEFIPTQMSQLQQIARNLKYRLPVGAVFWLGINAVARMHIPQAKPIYMNKTNYISIRLGWTPSKYGVKNTPPETRSTFYENVIKKFTELFEFAVAQNKVAPAE